MELIKNKSKHVPPLFKTLQRLPMSLGVKAKVLTMALPGNIWPPAAFLILFPCFPSCSPCSSHLPALRGPPCCSSDMPGMLLCQAFALSVPLPGNALPPESHTACVLIPVKSLFKRHLLMEAFSFFKVQQPFPFTIGLPYFLYLQHMTGIL